MENPPGVGSAKLPAGEGPCSGKARVAPLISVVTVVRNGEQFLAQTIASVIGQTYKNVELIIIDGNSTDNTLEVLKEYDQHIAHWVSEPDNGIYDAMNKGVKASKGEYLYFLNCADRFPHPDTLENVVTCLASSSPDILCGNVWEVHGEETYVYSSQISSEYELYHKTVCHQAIFTARHVFTVVGDFNVNYRICSDREWLLRALKIYGCRLHYIDLPICIFDISGVSSRQRRLLKWENLKINARYFRWRFSFFVIRQLAGKVERLLPFTR